MDPREPKLTVIWDDVVDFRELMIALVMGAIFGLGAYLVGQPILKNSLPHIQPGLLKGYSMMVGLGGSVVAGVIAANIFKPKRIFDASAETEDVAKAILALDLDPAEEAAALPKMSPKVRREMEQLGVWDAFIEFSASSGASGRGS